MDIEIKSRGSFQVVDFFLDHLALWFVKTLGIFLLSGWCNICRKPTVFLIRHNNLREDVICIWCRSSNRKRQMMYIFKKNCSGDKNNKIWNMESRGSFHKVLDKVYSDNYISSEYFGNKLVSGTFVNGVRHEDMCQTSFDSDSFDIILSSDDLEHVPDPQAALNEISRVLKPGGRFIFTAPFNTESDINDIRAKRKFDGSIDYLKEPQFHGDPLNPSEGILVYTIFGWQLLRMCTEAGMRCNIHKINICLYGILGANALVFDCQKNGDKK